MSGRNKNLNGKRKCYHARFGASREQDSLAAEVLLLWVRSLNRFLSSIIVSPSCRCSQPWPHQATSVVSIRYFLGICRLIRHTTRQHHTHVLQQFLPQLTYTFGLLLDYDHRERKERRVLLLSAWQLGESAVRFCGPSSAGSDTSFRYFRSRSKTAQRVWVQRSRPPLRRG